MPTIIQAIQPVTEFPNQYMSPFGSDGIIPLYSSIPINNNTNGSCLPCVVCGNSNIRRQIISSQAQNVETTLANGVSVAVGT
jgi:hypothetical protein